MSESTDTETRLAKLEREVSALRQERRMDQGFMNLAAGGTVAILTCLLGLLNGDPVLSTVMTGVVSYIVGIGLYLTFVRPLVSKRRGRFGNLAARAAFYEQGPSA